MGSLANSNWCCRGRGGGLAISEQIMWSGPKLICVGQSGRQLLPHMLFEGEKKGKAYCINEYFSSENSLSTIWSSAKATSGKQDKLFKSELFSFCTQANLRVLDCSGMRARALHCVGVWIRALIRIENLVRCHGFVSPCWPQDFCSSLLMNDVEALVCYAEVFYSVSVQTVMQSPNPKKLLWQQLLACLKSEPVST